MLHESDAPRQWRYRDLVALPEDRFRHELFDGAHVVTPSPGTVHQQIVWNLVAAFDRYLAGHPVGTALAGPFDIKFSPKRVLVPDLVYFSARRFQELVNDRCATGAPDLVVEILSPGTRRRDRGRKREIYDREGVREYWVVDPRAESIAVLRRAAPGGRLGETAALSMEAGDILVTPLLPGLIVPLSEVFAPSAFDRARREAATMAAGVISSRPYPRRDEVHERSGLGRLRASSASRGSSPSPRRDRSRHR